MTQQNYYFNEDRGYKKRLFYYNGIRYVEVKARIVNEYKPPTPVMKTSINQTLAGPSGLVNQGVSHYSAAFTLLFYSKKEYADWLQFIRFTHKYYDEKGSIYLGLVQGEPRIEAVEQETKYLVNVEFVFVKKFDYDYNNVPFTDIESHWAKQHIQEMTQRGLVTKYTYTGDEVHYFRPEDELTRAEAIAFLIRTYRYLDRILKG